MAERFVTRPVTAQRKENLGSLVTRRARMLDRALTQQRRDEIFRIQGRPHHDHSWNWCRLTGGLGMDQARGFDHYIV